MAFLSCFSCFKPEEDVEVTELDFAHCSLYDVPNDVFVHERTLECLDLESNNIRDLPRQLFHCHGLKVLIASDNDLHALPPALSSLSQLVELDVSKNVLTDVPDTIKQCKQLAVLDASVNPLRKIPEGCTQLLSLTELYLNDAFLEFLPANFGRLNKLRILELRENGLNSLPKSLSRLTALERLDIGQNDVSEVPEVIGSLTGLKELWMDANRIRRVPEFIGNLEKLVHLELSLNHVQEISDEIGKCRALQDLSLATNDLKSLPEAIGGLQSLVTLKLDDNQLEELPLSIGKFKNLEELFVSQNFLTNLPPSIGLCRKLHTLNVDSNDIEFLPKELGSCISLKILSAHGNRLHTLPAELDHITNLAVINLTANAIQNLPVSFTKLTRLTAVWLSENQHKPLVQLNQDTDPETGQRVLTNFMLPQQEANGKDDASESGSFHASVWEEERSRKSTVKWREESPDEEGFGGKGLRREPTPFPKEMRALAKRAQTVRSKAPADVVQRKRNGVRRRESDEEVEIREAKVTKPTVTDQQLLSLFQEEKKAKEEIELQTFEDLERTLQTTEEEGAPDKHSRDSGVMTPSEGSRTSPEHSDTRNPCDPLPPEPEIKTNEVDKVKPPPYHIAASMSKHANNFQAIHLPSDDNEYENQAVSESEASTAPSSLQTIVRSPYVPSDAGSDADEPPKPVFQSRIPTASPAPRIDPVEVDSAQNHASHLRKVSEQLLNNPRTRQSFTGSGSGSRIPSKIPSSGSRPSSRASAKYSTNQPVGSPHNIVGLPALSPSSQPENDSFRLENNGLLTTIEKAAHSDDEAPVNGRVASPPPRATKIPTLASVNRPSSATDQPNYENVSTVPSSIPVAVEKSMLPRSTPSDRISTAQFVAARNGQRKSPSPFKYTPGIAPELAGSKIGRPGASTPTRGKISASRIPTPKH